MTFSYMICELFALFCVGFFGTWAILIIWNFLKDAFSMCHDDYWF